MYSDHNSCHQIPQPIDKLTNILRRLPGIGARAAQRCAFELTAWDTSKQQEFLKAIENTFTKIKHCQRCGCWIESPHCVNCHHGTRLSVAASALPTLCIVAHPRQIYSMEKILESAGVANKTYQVLGGLIDPLRGIEIDDLRLKETFQRIYEEKFEEIILALDTTIEGDATSNILQELLEEKFPGISPSLKRPAFGMPINSSIEFVDPQTLAQAFSKRAQNST